MPASRYQGWAADAQGNVIPLASIRVKHEDSGLDVNPIWSVRTELSTKTNPFTADANGYFFFYAPPGRYRIEISDGVTTNTSLRDVQIGLASEYGVGTSPGNLVDYSSFAAVAFTGNYAQIADTPALGDMAFLDAGTSGAEFRTNTQNDGRFLRITNNLNDLESASSARANLGLGSTDTVSFGQLNIDNIRIEGNTISSTNTDGDINLSPNGTGDVVVPKDLKVEGISDFGVPGTESAGVRIDGTLYTPRARFNDVAGEATEMLAVLHKHSTSTAPIIASARANSNTPTHTNVTTSMALLDIIAAGWMTGSYRTTSRIRFMTGAGTISDTSAPGRIEFATVKNGEVNLTNALVIDEAQNATFTGTATVANATAGGHAVNRDTGDGRYGRLTAANTWTGDQSVTGAITANNGSTAGVGPGTVDAIASNTVGNRAGFRISNSAGGSVGGIAGEVVAAGVYPDAIGKVDIFVQDGVSTKVPATFAPSGVDVTGAITATTQIKPGSYTVATLPTAIGAGAIIYVSDESGGATIAFSDNTNWRRVSDRAIVT